MTEPLEYVVLALCICAVGVGAYGNWSTKRSFNRLMAARAYRDSAKVQSEAEEKLRTAVKGDPYNEFFVEPKKANGPYPSPEILAKYSGNYRTKVSYEPFAASERKTFRAPSMVQNPASLVRQNAPLPTPDARP